MDRKKLYMGGALAGLVAYTWGIFSWMVLPWHNATFSRIVDDTQVAAMVRANMPEEGVYFLPNHPDCRDLDAMNKKIAQETFMKRASEGPTGFLVVQPKGSRPMMESILMGLVIQVLAGLFMAWLLSMTQGLTLFKKALFVTGVAVTGGILTHLPEWNWMGFPCLWVTVAMADLAIAWFLGGLILAKVSAR